MTRRRLLLIIAGVLACSKSPRPWEEILPAEVEGWKRTEISPIPPTDIPESVRQLGLHRATAVTYTGPATLRARVFEMKVATSAFELIQKWRQQEGLAVYTGSYFLVADPGAASEAPRLLEALRKQVK